MEMLASKKCYKRKCYPGLTVRKPNGPGGYQSLLPPRLLLRDGRMAAAFKILRRLLSKK